jgi:hypothetical protein
MAALWVVTLINLQVDTIVLEEHNLQSLGLKMEAVCSSETMVPIYKSTGVTTQNTTMDIFTAVRTSNLL